MRRKELYFISAVLVLIGALLVVMIIQMVGGESLTGENPEPESADAMTCVSEARYPYLESKLGELSHDIKVNMLFDEGKIDTIGLYYNTIYENEERAEEAYLALVSEMNQILDKDGVDAKFVSNMRFTKNEDNVTMSLFAKRDGLTVTNEKYLLLQNDGGTELVVNEGKLVENYLLSGFRCK